MKKLSSFLCGLAVLGMMFTSCDNGKGPIGPIGDIVEDGFYVVGEATAFATLQDFFLPYSSSSLLMLLPRRRMLFAHVHRSETRKFPYIPR